MPQEPARSPRRRPVDVLFGEEVQLKPTAQEPDTKQATPGYMVEPPRPVTSLRPPPPEFPNDWHGHAPPEPVPVMEPPIEILVKPDLVALPPKPVMAETPVVEKVAEAVTFTVTEGARQTQEATASSEEGRRRTPGTESAPILVPPPMIVAAQPPAGQRVAPAATARAAAPAAPAALYGQTELLELSQFVDQLYQNVANETSDSAALNAECLVNLNAARAGIEKGAYAQAEAAAEIVKARLLRARASRAAASAPATRLLFVGLVLAALVGVLLFVLPFALRVLPAVTPVLRSTGLGMLGGAVMALYQLTRHVTRREYDAAFNSKYALSPLFGALTGAVMYLLSLLGILAAPNALGLTFEPFALLYLFALLGGMSNDLIFNTVQSLVGALTRRGARP